MLFILNIFGWENEYLFDNISHICVQKIWNKRFIDFSNNTFPIGTSYLIIPGEFDLLIKILNLNHPFKM